MATHTTVVVTCDNHPEKEAFVSIEVCFPDPKQGYKTEVDLCEACEKALGKVIGSGRSARVKFPRQITSAPSARRPAAETERIRTWAKANGISISGRGRIPKAVEDQYVQAVS